MQPLQTLSLLIGLLLFPATLHSNTEESFGQLNQNCISVRETLESMKVGEYKTTVVQQFTRIQDKLCRDYELFDQNPQLFEETARKKIAANMKIDCQWCKQTQPALENLSSMLNTLIAPITKQLQQNDLLCIADKSLLQQLSLPKNTAEESKSKITIALAGYNKQFVQLVLDENQLIENLALFQKNQDAEQKLQEAERLKQKLIARLSINPKSAVVNNMLAKIDEQMATHCKLYQQTKTLLDQQIPTLKLIEEELAKVRATKDDLTKKMAALQKLLPPKQQGRHCNIAALLEPQQKIIYSAIEVVVDVSEILGWIKDITNQIITASSTIEQLQHKHNLM